MNEKVHGKLDRLLPGKTAAFRAAVKLGCSDERAWERACTVAPGWPGIKPLTLMDAADALAAEMAALAKALKEVAAQEDQARTKKS